MNVSPMPDDHVAGSSGEERDMPSAQRQQDGGGKDEGQEMNKVCGTSLDDDDGGDDAVGHATDAETEEEKRRQDDHHRATGGGASSPSSAVQEAASRPGNNASYRASRPRTAPIRRKPEYTFSSTGGGGKTWPVLPFVASPNQGRVSTPNSASRAGKDEERTCMQGCGSGRGLGSEMEDGVVGMLSELASEYDTAGGGQRAWRGKEGIDSFVAEMGRVTGSQARVKWKGSIAQVGGVVEGEGAMTRCMRIEPATKSVRPLSPGSSRDQIGAAKKSELNRRLETAKAAQPTHVGINRALASAMMRCTRATALKNLHVRRPASTAPRRATPAMSEAPSFASGVSDELVYDETSPRRMACDVWRPRFASSSPPTPVRRNSASSTSSPTFVSLSMDRSSLNRPAGQGGDAARVGDQRSRLRFFMEASRPQQRPASAQGGLSGRGGWGGNASHFRMGSGEASHSEGGNPPMCVSASKRPASAPAKRSGWGPAAGAGDGVAGVCGGGIRIMLPVVRDDERLVNAEDSFSASFKGWSLGDDHDDGVDAQDLVSPLATA